MKTRLTFIAALVSALALPALAQTAAPATAPNPAVGPAGAKTEGMTMTSRARHAAFKNEKDQLEEALKTAQNRADYKSVLEKNGYKISAINADKKDYLEYEVVKGNKTYEVQLDFDDGAAKAKKVDVTTNMWRAEGTKKMMADSKYVATGPMVADPDGKYSDRRYEKKWTGEKDELEKALAGSMKPADYRAKLEKMGYKITSVNDREKDYVEYEIVKGDHSYEVQIDLDPKTQMGKKVDVAANIWETDATERAKGEK